MDLRRSGLRRARPSVPTGDDVFLAQIVELILADAGSSDGAFVACTGTIRAQDGTLRATAGQQGRDLPGLAGQVTEGGAMRYVIAEPCIDCKDESCIEVCPVDCIYEGDRMRYIHPDQCVACGACEWACPVEAIFHEDGLPAKWSHYADVNAAFAISLGAPERASRTAVGVDHPVVSSLPVQPVQSRGTR